MNYHYHYFQIIFFSPDDLDPRDEAEAEEEAEEAAILGNEVDGGHPEGALELENGRLLGNRLTGIRILVIENMLARRSSWC